MDGSARSSVVNLSRKQILLVEDDACMRGMIEEMLRSHNFFILGVSDAAQAKRIGSTKDIDLAIVDLNLGREDGLVVVRDMADRVPVIIITGNRVEEADKVLGLELGAVEYITKPFRRNEFIARVRSRLRRRERVRTAWGRYSFGDLRLDLDVRELTRNGALIELSPGEFNLLSAFVRNPRRVLSRQHLLHESRIRNDAVADRSVDVLILRLRRKLESNPSKPALLKNVRKMGYVLDAEVLPG